jgi:hypothetical protein
MVEVPFRDGVQPLVHEVVRCGVAKIEPQPSEDFLKIDEFLHRRRIWVGDHGARHAPANQKREKQRDEGKRQTNHSGMVTEPTEQAIPQL